jgi:lipoate-protein ligase B
MDPSSLLALPTRPGSRSEFPGEVLSLPLMDYEAARRLQWRLHEERVSDVRPETLVLVEHEPVLTLGRTAKDAHWNGLDAVSEGRGLRVIESERGGSVTYHGPGQVVGYPIVKLRHFCPGPKAYMRMLEEVIIRVLSDWGIEGRRVDKFVGVWVQDPGAPDGPLAKIAAMGVKITRGVTLHGFALNVTVDLAPYAGIVPCGIEGCRVTSMAEVLHRQVSLHDVRHRIARCFGDVFGVYWQDPRHKRGAA